MLTKSKRKLKARICKAPECDTMFIPANGFHTTCSPICAVAYARYRSELKQKKEWNKEKKEYKKTDKKIRKQQAKFWCHKYIRYRDRNEPCICCGQPLTNGYQAGHFIPSGQNPQIRYDEDNIHAQNLNCNYFKGGDSGDYEKNLIAKIGIDRVNLIQGKKGGTDKRTVEDYLEIEEYYKNKLKLLKEAEESGGTRS